MKRILEIKRMVTEGASSGGSGSSGSSGGGSGQQQQGNKPLGSAGRGVSLTRLSGPGGIGGRAAGGGIDDDAKLGTAGEEGGSEQCGQVRFDSVRQCAS